MIKFRNSVYSGIIAMWVMPIACMAEGAWILKGSLVDYNGSGLGFDLGYEIGSVRINAMRAQTKDSSENEQAFNFAGLDLDIYKQSTFFKPYIKFGFVSSSEYKSSWKSTSDVVYLDSQKETNKGVGAGFGMSLNFKDNGRPFVFLEGVKGHGSISLVSLGCGFRFF